MDPARAIRLERTTAAGHLVEPEEAPEVEEADNAELVRLQRQLSQICSVNIFWSSEFSM